MLTHEGFDALHKIRCMLKVVTWHGVWSGGSQFGLFQV